MIASRSKILITTDSPKTLRIETRKSTVFGRGAFRKLPSCGYPPLGDIQIGHDLQTRYQRRMEFDVEPDPWRTPGCRPRNLDRRGTVRGFDMDVARSALHLGA